MDSNNIDGTPLMYLEPVFFGITIFVAIYFFIIICVMVYRTKILCYEKNTAGFTKNNLINLQNKKPSKISLKVNTQKIGKNIKTLKNNIPEIKLKKNVNLLKENTKSLYTSKIIPNYKKTKNNISKITINCKDKVIKEYTKITKKPK
jgi:hypothetical protein